ncbi:TRAP transporter small permease [Verrucomicrobiaceae bacterium N1E253]|uniref:TRAP transporter small permease n=1 Tax=Oceaniferula marina TaxID=2748318 RepID=A0A851GDP1_9BACT|nr:TRAP transporter small permease [Oceaniferula marina]NWK55536.1 TRAP transporter small permease [Oceaniferula marina]
MQSLNRILHAILTWFSIGVFTILIIDVVLGVGSRYLVGNQIRWTEELATFLLVWLVFCGAAIAYRDNAHLGINLLMTKLHPGAAKKLRIVALIIVLFFTLAVMVVGGIQLTMERLHFGQMMSTLGIQKAWLYLSVPFSGTFIALFNIEMLINTIQSKTEGSADA